MQLIDAGLDIMLISEPLGHRKPDITLRVYAHLFRKDDSRVSRDDQCGLEGLGGT